MFISKLIYCIYIQGCYCPPHRGHFETVKRFTDIGENINVIIHQVGSESRHGVPSYFNRKMWKLYIENLLPSHRIDLLKYNNLRFQIVSFVIQELKKNYLINYLKY